jgi:two-component system, NtrC family, sensor kinase
MHDIVPADGGRAAIEILKTDQAFDVVLCDVVMPDLDGASVLEFVRDHVPALMPRFLFLTGGAVTQRARAIVEEKPAPVLEKPVSLDTLLEVIARVSFT